MIPRPLFANASDPSAMRHRLSAFGNVKSAEDPTVRMGPRALVIKFRLNSSVVTVAIDSVGRLRRRRLLRVTSGVGVLVRVC